MADAEVLLNNVANLWDGERFEKQDGLPIIKFSLKFFEEETKFKVIYGQDPLKESGFACI